MCVVHIYVHATDVNWVMARYIALIDEKARKYRLTFPDAPGCVAVGKSPDEVVSNGIDVLADWMGKLSADGKGLPRPRTFEQLRKHREVAEALASGLILVLIPLVMETGRPARANISLDAGLLVAIDEAAQRNGVTRSAFLAAAARDKIKATA